MLDWRLAFDMLRVAVNGDGATIDLHSLLPDGATNPWHPLTDGGGDVLGPPAKAFGYNMINTGRGRVFRKDDGQVLLEGHPLWTEDHPALVEARRTFGAQVRLVNPFRIVRRPGDIAATVPT